jgi:hypothetical protein
LYSKSKTTMAGASIPNPRGFHYSMQWIRTTRRRRLCVWISIVWLVMILWFVLVPTLWNHIANLHALCVSLVWGGTNTMIGWPLRFNSWG